MTSLEGSSHYIDPLKVVMSHLGNFRGYLLPRVMPNLGHVLVYRIQHNQLVLVRTYTPKDRQRSKPAEAGFKLRDI